MAKAEPIEVPVLIDVQGLRIVAQVAGALREFTTIAADSINQIAGALEELHDELEAIADDAQRRQEADDG